MAICHGSGLLEEGGCCYVNGEVCPLRIEIREDGNVYLGADTLLGTLQEVIDDYATQYGYNSNNVEPHLRGVKWLCKAALEVLLEDSSRWNDRAAFEAAWDNHREYKEKVRPWWGWLEIRGGMPEGSYNCSTWTGGCCFTESTGVNKQKERGLSNVAVQIRRAGGT